MHFVIIGSGGIGGYYGARLQTAGERVTFIARGAHLEAMQTRGLRLNHPELRFDAPVTAVTLEQFLERTSPADVDLIVLAVKAIDTRTIALQLADWTGDAPTPVLSLQNGVDNEPALAEVLGARRVIGGLAVRISSHLTEPGVIEALGPAEVVMGEWPKASAGTGTEPGPAPFLARIETLFKAAGIPARVTDNIQAEVWRKLVINNGVNPLSALTRLDSGVLTRDPGFSRIVYGLMTEAAAAAAADGVTLTEADCLAMFEVVYNFGSFKTSMQVDIEHNRPLEIEEICGAVLERSRRIEREAPYTFTIYHLLRTAVSRPS